MADPIERRAPDRGGWHDILRRVWDGLTGNHLSILAAGVAFYGFLSLFPGLVALVSLYGLIADPVEVENHLAALSGIVPSAAEDLLNDRLKAIVQPGTGLSYAFALSVAVACWSAASAMKALMGALNIAYGEDE